MLRLRKFKKTGQRSHNEYQGKDLNPGFFSLNPEIIFLIISTYYVQTFTYIYV